MQEKILLISEKNEDMEILNRVLGPEGFTVTRRGLDRGIKETILENGFPLILADYDILGEETNIFYDMLKGESKACIIFYGSDIGGDS